MPKDEAKAEPMTEARLAEIRDAMELERVGYHDEPMPLPERWYCGIIDDLLAEVDRLRALADDDTSLLDWASTNFTNHSLTISEAIDEGYSLRDALRGARDGTLADELYGDDDEDA